MLSIDEAIARERQLAKEQRGRIGTWYSKIMGYDDEYIKKCEVCAEEHEQLAEWLEELKSYRASVFSGYMTQKMLKEEYNKAIDDFMKELQKKIEKDLANPDLALECKKCGIWKNYDIEEIAEQLKAGGKNV